MSSNITKTDIKTKRNTSKTKLARNTDSTYSQINILDTISFQTISSLRPAYVLGNDDLFEISVKTETEKQYNSKCIKGESIKTACKDYTIKFLEENYKLQSTTNFELIEQAINSYLNGDDTNTIFGRHAFNEPPIVINSVEKNWLSEENKQKCATIKSLLEFSKDENALFINKSGSYNTSYKNIENDEMKSVSGLTNALNIDEKQHNSFIFRLVGSQSESWKCVTSGWFTCFGWVAEDNIAANHPVNRWVALEGYFGDENEWKVLQFFPIHSSAECSYVSFSLPVKEGLELRLRSGFKVGSNSGLYWNYRNSVTNHIANAFVGGIYSGFSS